MNKSVANTVRAAFALLVLGLTLYAGIDTLAAHELASRGLNTCGSAANPCSLAPLRVTPETPATLASHHLAPAPAAAHAPRMAMAAS